MKSIRLARSRSLSPSLAPEPEASRSIPPGFQLQPEPEVAAPIGVLVRGILAELRVPGPDLFLQHGCPVYPNRFIRAPGQEHPKNHQAGQADQLQLLGVLSSSILRGEGLVALLEGQRRDY